MKMISIQNVTFFHEKNMILISRGMRKTWLSKTQGGALVVKIKGFDRYWFDPDTGKVYSRKSSKFFVALKKHEEETKHYFWLFHNGEKQKVYLWKILMMNMSGIELFFNERVHPGTELKLVA